MSKFDTVDGGIPATFLDGPKAGHLGVVTPVGKTPPAELRFLDDLVYRRFKPTKIDALNIHGQQVQYRGVSYRVDPGCGFVARMNAEIAKAQHDLDTGRVETK
jgi:hypothetical protein